MFLSPTPVDLFSRYMAEMFDERQIISVPTGFQVFFGNPASGSYTHYSPDAADVDIDIIRGTKKTAALIPRGMVSRPLGSSQKDLHAGRFTTFNRKYPLSEEESNINASEILFRQAGESPYSTKTRLERMREKARDLHLENIRRHIRLFEVLAKASVMTGKMPAILGTTNTDLIYDFKRKSAHTFGAGTKWDNSGDVFGDIDTACDLLEANGNVDPNFMAIGGVAFSGMVNNTVFQTLADNRRMEFIQVSQNLPVPPEFARFVAAGWIAQGRLRTPKGYSLWVFTYNRTYQDANGTATKLMPEDQAFICSTEARCDRYFGPPELLPMTRHRVQIYQDYFGFDPSVPPMPPNILAAGAVVDPSMFYCDCYESSDGKALSIRTQSAPIFVTTQTDAFVTMTGLVTLS
jgi:Phage major capsid protein E